VSVTTGQRLTLEVSKIVHGGWGIGRHDGQVIFCQGVLPDETVDVVITDVKKGHAFADLLAVGQAHPDRVPHVWPEADDSRPPENRVGGADFGHISLSRQRQIKSEVVRESLARQGQVDEPVRDAVTVVGIPGRQDGTRWRTRVTLHVDEDGTAGARAFHSHWVIPTETLPLAHEALEQLAAHQKKWPGAATVSLGVSSGGQVWSLTDSDKDQVISEEVAGHRFELSARGFWQVHHDAAEVLFEAVWRAVDASWWDPEAENLDLYGGSGLFAVSLAAHGGTNTRVVSVESSADASRSANAVLAPFDNAQSVAMSTAAFLTSRAHTPELFREATIVMDPPRSGAGAEIIRSLTALAPRQIVYVACDPVAFARDQKLLASAGYQLTSVEGFDLFPHTHHVELVAGFVRHD
jgi:tRNA/tmRNA/rRNA uracil-C5-methylase (TrmA/RlmC/RlmD family)